MLRTPYFIGIKGVAWKVNLRACNLYPDYSNSFILSNASELFLGRISSLERERNFSCRLFTPSIKREIRHFPVVVVQWRQRNVQKSVLLFCLFNLLLFWRSRCRHRRGILKSLMIASVQKPPPPLLEKNWRVQASPRLFFFFWRERGVCTLAVEMSTYNSKRNVLNFSTFVTNIILWNRRSNKAHQLFFNWAPLHFAVNNRQANCQLACMTSWTCPPSSRAPERRFPFSFPAIQANCQQEGFIILWLTSYSWPIEFLIWMRAVYFF